MKKFLIVDDHAIVRNGMNYMLREFYKPCVVEEAQNELEVMEKLRASDFDLVILDINIPNTNTIDLLRHILIKKTTLKVLMFSMNSEKMHAKLYLDAGAMGFISKDAAVEEIRKAIDIIMNNRKYYSEGLIDSLINQKTDLNNSNPFKRLTEREFEIVNLFIAGKSLTEISSILNIQRSTTGTHKNKIFEKLNVNNIVELITPANLYKQ